jgi:DUF4097 and DUF4098 domain-containing protein YvlB
MKDSLKENVDENSINQNTISLSDSSKIISINLVSGDLTIEGDPSLSNIQILDGLEEVDVREDKEYINIVSKKDLPSSFKFFNKKVRPIVIKVPHNIAIKSKTVSGDIEAISLNQDTSLKSVSGDINITSSNGSIKLDTISGDIRIKNSKEIQKAISKSGDLEILSSKISGTVKSYSGDISIKTSSISDSNASSFSGDIEIQSTKAIEELLLKTTSGDINIKIISNGGTISGKNTENSPIFTGFDQNQIVFSNDEIKFGNEQDLNLEVKTSSGDEKIELIKEINLKG